MARHKVPTHLNIADGIWKFSYRQIILVMVPLVFILPDIWHVLPNDSPAVSDLVRAYYPRLAWLFPAGSLPLLPLLVSGLVWSPFLIAALPLDPPAEHGLLVMASWLVRGRGRRAPEAVARDLGEIVISDDRIDHDDGISAVWEVSTTNLRLGSTGDVEQAEDRMGEFVTGLTTGVQIVVRSLPVDPEPVVAAIERYEPTRNTFAASGKPRPRGPDVSTPATNARTVAAALRKQVKNHALLERRHFIATCAPDEQEFADSVDEATSAIESLGLRTEAARRLAGDEAAEVVQQTWSMRRDPARHALGPLDRVFNAVGAWFADDQWHVVLAWGKWPRLVRDNALAPFVDGPYETDFVMFIDPVDPDTILDGLERRSDSMKLTDQMSTRWRKRTLAIDDLDNFILDLESGEQSAFDVAIYLHVRGRTKKQAETLARKVAKRVKRSGAKARFLPCEQAAAIASMAPIGVNRLDRRVKRVNTDPLKNLFPFTASAMWMDRAIPLGETLESKRLVGLNTWRQPIIPNPQMVIYAISGGGKGFEVKVQESRELFAGLTQEIFGFDQATENKELGEYGRFAQYCGIEYRHVDSRADFTQALADLDNYKWLGPGLIWNIAQLPLEDRPEFVATVKAKLWTRAAAHPAFRKIIFDELWSLVKGREQMSADPIWLAKCLGAIEEVARLGRHLKLGGIYMTQRVKDSVDLPVMQIIQDQCQIQFYGMQNPSHISDVADRLHWTPAIVNQIKRLHAGEFVLSAGPWQVAMRVTATDEEYAMAHTDGIGTWSKAA